MMHKKAEAQLLAPGQLRSLLTLSRDLLQIDEAGASLDMIGRALAEMLQPESALLLVRAERLQTIGFDRQGACHPATAGHPLYRAGMHLLSDHDGKETLVHQDQQLEHGDANTLALAVPAQGAVAVLAVAWGRAPCAAELERCKRTLSYILQLAAAALGRIEGYRALVQRVREQRDELTNTSASHAVELARRDELAAEFQMLSLTDVLTGLYNRRGFFLQAEQIYKLARRRRLTSAVIFADIDGLKRVNDELGHDAGDCLIRDAALVFRESFRQADVVARLGGDEFVAYTLDDERPGVILQRIESNLRAFNLKGERPYAVSMSTGVVQCEPGGEHALSHYVRLADQQMYAHKRNRLH